MKGISIRQPWVYAIFHLGKDIENRDWPTNVRGRVAVQASATMAWYDYEEAHQWIFQNGCPGFSVPPKDQYTLGAIVGTVEIADCVSNSDSSWFVGEYGFVLRYPILLPEPIPFKGMLGFWEVPKDIEALMEVNNG